MHVAPPEEEVIRPRQQIGGGAPQKHYKIIFIKTPTPQNQLPAQVTLGDQNEEKTIVYVLVKKPDEQAEVEVKQAPTKEPSKPEVYFIKYKTQRESSSSSSSASASGTSSYDVKSGLFNISISTSLF